MTGDLRRAAAATLLGSFPGTTLPDWLGRAVDAGLGGVCLYGSNTGIAVGAAAAALHDRRADLVVALDEEGGDVTRLEAATGSSVPGNAALGAVDDVDLTGRVAGALGRLLAATGVDLDLAPCADVNSDAANPVIGVRAFGARADLAARHVAAFVQGLQAAGVAACAKHFPGHGDVAVDSHVDLPTVPAPAGVLAERELTPFRAAIAAGVRAVMPGHLLVPALDAVPATVSSRVITGALRGELGFAGVVVTDALDMGGIGGRAAIPPTVVRALAAGADLCCLGPDNDEALIVACVDAIEAAVADGSLPAARVEEAASRVATLRRSPTPAVGARADRAHAELVDVGREAAVRALRVEGELPGRLGGAHVVELDRPANIAAGDVPWGVAATLTSLDRAATSTRVPEGDGAAVADAVRAAAGRPVVVVVRDAQRRPAQAAALGELLAARPDAVVVDMGWPTDPAHRPPASAWITTHGAARASGEAVARLLVGAPADDGVPRPPSPTPASPGRTSRG